MTSPDETYSEAETERLFKATLHKMLTSPHQPHEPAAGKKHKAKRAKSPRRKADSARQRLAAIAERKAWQR